MGKLDLPQVLRVARGEPAFVKYVARSTCRSSYKFMNGCAWY